MLVVGPGLASVPSRVQMIRISTIRSSLLKASSGVTDSSGLRRYGGGAGGGGVGVVNSVGGPASSGAGSRCLHVFGRFRRHHQQLRHLSNLTVLLILPHCTTHPYLSIKGFEPLSTIHVFHCTGFTWWLWIGLLDLWLVQMILTAKIPASPWTQKNEIQYHPL